MSTGEKLTGKKVLVALTGRVDSAVAGPMAAIGGAVTALGCSH